MLNPIEREVKYLVEYRPSHCPEPMRADLFVGIAQVLNAVRTPLSDRGRLGPLALGKTYLPRPVIGCSSSRISIA